MKTPTVAGEGAVVRVALVLVDYALWLTLLKTSCCGDWKSLQREGRSECFCFAPVLPFVWLPLEELAPPCFSNIILGNTREVATSMQL